MGTTNTKILIADDHAIVRMGLASLLNTQDGLEVVGDAEDGEDAIRKTLELQPDVVIMDLMMPKKDGRRRQQRYLPYGPRRRFCSSPLSVRQTE